MIFGLGIGYGGYLTLASYNRFQNFYVLDAMLVVIVHIIVRLMVAVIVLGFIGYLAFQTNMSMAEVRTKVTFDWEFSVKYIYATLTCAVAVPCST